MCDLCGSMWQNWLGCRNNNRPQTGIVVWVVEKRDIAYEKRYVTTLVVYHLSLTILKDVCKNLVEVNKYSCFFGHSLEFGMTSLNVYVLIGLDFPNDNLGNYTSITWVTAEPRQLVQPLFKVYMGLELLKVIYCYRCSPSWPTTEGGQTDDILILLRENDRITGGLGGRVEIFIVESCNFVNLQH